MGVRRGGGGGNKSGGGAVGESGLGVRSGGGMGGCQQRIEVIVCENAKKSQDGRGSRGLSGGGGGVAWG